MKMTYGRKFWTGLTLMGVLLFVFVFTAIVVPSAINPMVLVTFGAYYITVGFMYIGGNIWSSWVKSKYFHSELLSGGGK